LSFFIPATSGALANLPSGELDMELNKAEMKAVEVAIEEKNTSGARELDALELVLVGGGCGDVQF
jgi:hypothetical protein